ncbi:MAG TPA: hypothetical protein VNU94_03335 [Acidobacteriaceae bacterium]|nr:hypothetical protein [Acidobacteriaceae bacterium]
MKYNAGGNTPRTIDPTLTRKRGALSHPGSLLLVAVALIFFAYMFGLLPQLDTYFNSLTHSIDNQRDAAMTIWQYAPIVGGGIAILILTSWLWSRAADALKHSAKRGMVAGRKTLSVDEFTALAAKHSVSAKVAQQTYKFLQHDYTHSMKVDLNDDLRRDLHWKENHVLDVMGNLARHSDRKKNLKANPEAIRTVLDLLLYVESCPKHFLTESSAQRRKAGHSTAKPSGVRRAITGVTRMLQPAHKRADVLKAMQTPAEQAVQAAPATEAKQEPLPEKKPALSFIRPRKFPPVDNRPGSR